MMPSLVPATCKIEKKTPLSVGRTTLTAMDRDEHVDRACWSRVHNDIVLNKAGQIQWAKDGSLTPEEVDHVIALAQKLINE